MAKAVPSVPSPVSSTAMTSVTTSAFSVVPLQQALPAGREFLNGVSSAAGSPPHLTSPSAGSTLAGFPPRKA